MAIVFQCDICGRCYPYPKNSDEINRISFEQVRYSTQSNLNYLDICPDCAKAFEKLIEERKSIGGLEHVD